MRCLAASKIRSHFVAPVCQHRFGVGRVLGAQPLGARRSRFREYVPFSGYDGPRAESGGAPGCAESRIPVSEIKVPYRR